MTGAELKILRKKLGMTVRAAAAAMQKSPRTVFRWESCGDEEINRASIDLFVITNSRRLKRIEKQNVV